MNITQMAFEFIAKNPDQKMRDIIAAFPDCKPVSVKSAVYRLYTEGRRNQSNLMRFYLSSHQ